MHDILQGHPLYWTLDAMKINISFFSLVLVTCRFYDGSGFYLLDGDNNIEDFTLSSTSSKDKIKHRPVKICINPYHNTFCDLLLSNGELQSCEVGTFTSHR